MSSSANPTSNITIYGIKNCNTMKKAFDALNQCAIQYEFYDYKKTAPTTEHIQFWLSQVDENVLLNKKGTTWKKLSPEQQAYALENQAQLIETLINHPSLIKRPVLDFKGKIFVGFDESTYLSLK